jgi:hypothetical protein
MAYAEIRLILAKLLLAFDLELDPASADWTKKQKSYIAWDKTYPPMMVKLIPRN